MLQQPPLWFIVIAFICAIGPLVFFHELGHYLVARWFGVGAEQFSIGFGREIIGWTDKRGTRWKVGWLPLGGYVRFVGDMNAASQADANADLSDSQRKVAFHNKPVWQRFLIVLAGPTANYLLAVLIIAALLVAVGRPTPNSTAQVIQPNSAAAAAGLQPGDRIVAIAGQSTDSFQDIVRIVTLRPGETVPIRYERQGQPHDVNATLKTDVIKDKFGRAYTIGRLGVGQKMLTYERLSLPAAIPEAVGDVVKTNRAMIDGLWQIITGKRSAKELGGPAKMAQVAGEQLTLGWVDFLALMALFSINLGFINLLPIPMLDGGHLLLYGAEAIRRKPISLAAQDWAFRGGLAFLLALLFFVTFNDLSSFGLF